MMKLLIIVVLLVISFHAY
ncbi:type I toxin-antitoxin system Ibs family toxin [Escherichia coli]